jgi:hypothetical protein
MKGWILEVDVEIRLTKISEDRRLERESLGLLQIIATDLLQKSEV